MRAGREHGAPGLRGGLRGAPAQPHELGAQLGERAAHRGDDLELRRADLALRGVAEQRVRAVDDLRSVRQAAGRRVDEVVLLLDAQRRARLHARSMAVPHGRQTRAMSIPVTGLAHVRLTVTDYARSREFYDRVLALPVAFEVPEDADEQTRQQLGFLYGGVIYALGDSLLGLRPVAPEGDRFDEDRVGLDHLSLAVPDRAALDAAAARLDELGVPHGGVKDLGRAAILEFRDPDGIALELYAAA